MKNRLSNKLKNLVFILCIKSPAAAVTVILTVAAVFYFLERSWGFSIFR